MSTIVSYTSCFSWTGSSGCSQVDYNCPSKYLLINSAKWKVVSSMEKARSCGDANHAIAELEEDVDEINDELNLKRLGVKFTRRSAICSSTLLCLASSTSAFGYPGGEAMAVVKQGLLAGRVPGLSEPDEQGWRTYQRPEDKSGGHGVGWSPIVPYKFSVPQDWDEVPVSIADLGGTEIDLRFGSAKEGRLFVIVAPVKRFSDSLGDDTNIEEIGAPEKVINAFGPEVIGDNVEGKVLSAEVAEHSGRKYYQFELEPPHVLITATAAGNRLYLFNVTGNGLQWKRHYNDLKRIADSFRVI